MRIPEELIIQVLKEVDVKSLLRFRCVSKRWLSIIDDPIFVSLHRERSHSRAGGAIFLIKLYPSFHRAYLYKRNTNLEYKFACFYHTDGDDFWMCAEGLLLSCGQIWNLSTRKRIYYPRLPARNLPRPTNLTKEFRLRTVRSFLGFDPLSKEYKLVSVYVLKRFTFVNEQIGTEEKHAADILTLGGTKNNNSWRSIVDVNDVIPGNHPIWSEKYCNTMTCCCINGILYIHLQNIKRADIATASLITFDLGCEKFRIIPFPNETPHKSHHIGYDSRGNLCLLRFEYFRPPLPLPTWGWKLEDARSGKWIPQGRTCCSKFSTRYCPDLLNATTTTAVPDELNELLHGRSYLSCQTVETLFHTNKS